LISQEEIETALSPERFSRYVTWADGDHERAVELYTLNAKLSEALYLPLQMLEVVLRNRVHTVLAVARHEDWFHDEGMLLLPVQKEQLSKAIADIQEDGRPATAGRLVAALTFSFWTSMLSPAYETLWQTSLHQIARREDGKGLRRKDLSGPLTPIRTLRNRVAHHEPIIQWNLPKHHANIIQLTQWFSPGAARWVRSHSRFDLVHPSERIKLFVPPLAASFKS